MSSLIVEVREFKLEKHPNADSLSLCYPSGTSWQCCVRTVDFENETLGIYIPVDSMLPYNLAVRFGLPVKEDKDYRLKTIRLRGELAQGLMIGYNAIYDLIGDAKLGDDVSEVLNITKYEPPVRGNKNNGAGKFIQQPEGFPKYTDIENIKNFPNVLDEVLEEDDEVVITEKLHGSNARFGWVNTEEGPKFYVGTRKMVVDLEDTTNSWVKLANKYNLPEKLQPYPGYVVFGELFGKGVQKLEYNLPEQELRLFDVQVNGNKYLDWDDYVEFTDKVGLERVPFVYKGKYNASLLELRKGKSDIASHIKEGVVIKPTKEKWHRRVGRVILKSISEEYLLKDYDE